MNQPYLETVSSICRKMLQTTSYQSSLSRLILELRVFWTHCNSEPPTFLQWNALHSLIFMIYIITLSGFIKYRKCHFKLEILKFCLCWFTLTSAETQPQYGKTYFNLTRRQIKETIGNWMAFHFKHCNPKRRTNCYIWSLRPFLSISRS